MGSHTPAVFEFGAGMAHLSQSLISIAAELLARTRLHGRGNLDVNFSRKLNILNGQHMSTKLFFKSLCDWQTENQLPCCLSNKQKLFWILALLERLAASAGGFQPATSPNERTICSADIGTAHPIHCRQTAIRPVTRGPEGSRARP
jgi:hypothetical protein